MQNRDFLSDDDDDKYNYVKDKDKDNHGKEDHTKTTTDLYEI